MAYFPIVRRCRVRWQYQLLALSLACLSGVAGAQESAGKFLMAIGQVEIRRGDQVIAVKKNTEVMAGDTLVTGPTSNAQVRFNDGAVVALRPETEFRVDEYRYAGKPDGTEKASVSLIKGGVRAVTGAIGRSNRDNLKVNAVVATIGIRGTGFNITFCGAACKASNSNANEGLYAGVFEGKVDVSNRGGAASDLGVNRFAYVKDENTAPVLLVAPPSFLKDSLEGQVRIQPKTLAINSASENAASLQNATATVKAPTTSSSVATAPQAEKVQEFVVKAKQPDVIDNIPKVFFDSASGTLADRPPTTPAASTVMRLRAAEYCPTCSQQNSAGSENQISLNRQIDDVVDPDPNKTAVRYDGQAAVQIRAKSGTYRDYVLDSAYGVAKEAGASAGVVSWGRWTGKMQIGGYNGGQPFTLSENQGWHYIVGTVLPSTSTFPGLGLSGELTMSVIGGTKPTELRDAALASNGWRLSGGSLAVNFATLRLNGDLLLYYADSSGYGNFKNSYEGSLSSNPSALNTFQNASMVRTSGNTSLCTSSCSGTVKLGFYGDVNGATAANVRAGVTYQVNTGANGVIQGVAVYK